MAKSTVIKPDKIAVVLPGCYVSFDRPTGPDSKVHKCYSSGQLFSCPPLIFRMHKAKRRQNLREATPAEIKAGKALPPDERDIPVEPDELIENENDTIGDGATV